MEVLKELIQHKSIQLLVQALGQKADLHLVGGCIRDSILGNSPKDLDLATVFTPDEVEAGLKANNIHYIVTGIRRGTITAVIEGEPFEITTFRNPENEKEFVKDIEVDLGARDFTINAIALNVVNGQLVDPYGGLKDLKGNTLSAVRNPMFRFAEDPHRIVRMIRFGPGQGRSVEQNTLAAAKNLVDMVSFVSAERIHDELLKIVCCRQADEAFRVMHNIGLLSIILPELEKAVGMTQNQYHKYDVFEHTLHALVEVPPTKILRMAALLHDIGKPNVKSIDPETGQGHFYSHEEEGKHIGKSVV